MPPPVPPSGAGPAAAVYRIRFQKAGDLRLISHHDLLRCFERMLRRAGLPFHSSQGFNPRPRLRFALSLALGIVGRAELVDLELDAELPAAEVHVALVAQAPQGLDILEVCRIDRRAGLQVRGVTYFLPVPPERHAGLAERCRELLAATECCVDRVKPTPRRVNLRPYLANLRPTPAGLEMDLAVTPQGTARPDEVLRLLALDDLLLEGAVLERTRLELHPESLLSPFSVPPEPVEASHSDSSGTEVDLTEGIP